MGYRSYENDFGQNSNVVKVSKRDRNCPWCRRVNARFAKTVQCPIETDEHVTCDRDSKME